MVHPKVNINARYSALLSQTDTCIFVSRSIRGIRSLASITEISYSKQESGMIRVRVFLKETIFQKEVADKLYANDMKAFGFKSLRRINKK
jgi:hypothetical protein